MLQEELVRFKSATCQTIIHKTDIDSLQNGSWIKTCDASQNKRYKKFDKTLNKQWNLASKINWTQQTVHTKLWKLNHKIFILISKYIMHRLVGCNWGMQIDWWLQPRAVFGHTLNGIIWLAYATEIKSIQLHDSIAMASPQEIVSVTLHWKIYILNVFYNPAISVDCYLLLRTRMGTDRVWRYIQSC